MTANAAWSDLTGDLAFDPDELRETYRIERDKRLRPDGNAQYIDLTGDFGYLDDDPWATPITRDPTFREVEVAVLGGGFAGLVMGARLSEAGIDDFLIVDKAGDFGGTWYWNRYPGVNCDVESYLYLPLLEETGYIPKHKYSFGTEIFAYCQLIGRKYGLYERALFQTVAEQLHWDESGRRWTVTTDRGDRLSARYVVWAGGGTSKLKLPGIPGIKDFTGKMFHTSRWDYGYTGGDLAGNTHLNGDEVVSNMTNLADKRVGIIGTGATAVQAVPHLGVASKHLYVFQRTPSSVDVRANRETDPEWGKGLGPGWQQRRADNFVSIIHGVGDETEDLVADGWTDLTRISGFAVRRRAEQMNRTLSRAETRLLVEIADFEKMEAVRNRVASIVRDPATAEALKPYYRQFCKRPTFHDGYLNTFNRPNVTLVDTHGKGVDRVTETGVEVDGVHYELDCLIFATGFDIEAGAIRGGKMSFISGRKGVTLAEKWGDRPTTLHGLQTAGFPNLFFVPGPKSSATVLIPYTYSEMARHAVYILEEARRRGATVVEADDEVEIAWCEKNTQSHRFGTSFAESCTPGYYNNEGQVATGRDLFSATYPGLPTEYIELLQEWRREGTFSGVLMD